MLVLEGVMTASGGGSGRGQMQQRSRRSECDSP